MIDSDFNFYGFFLLLGFVANVIISIKLLKRSNFESNLIFQYLIYEFLGIIMGGKLYTYVNSFPKYLNKPFLSIGLSSLGGVIGAIIAVLIFSWQFKVNKKRLFTISIIPMPLMYALGKVGCFIAGCCYGIKYDGIFSIVYEFSNSAPLNVRLFPVQIVETLIFFFIFLYILFIYKKDENDYKIISSLFILCGISKFLLEYLRFSHYGMLITVNQFVCLIFVVIGIVLKIRGFFKNKSYNFNLHME